jgi:dipeptidyl aminopeptidase/acylaminoacyl peptidase
MHTTGGIQESDDRQLGFETLARQLVASGLADENKIALDGFSRNGYFVDYTLAHSAFPFAAAIAGDNYEPSYFQSALANWRQWDEITNGASAFGAGLQTWLAHAPGFNAEHIHTPLMMIGQSGGIVQIIGEWEIYSRLRHLHKPVEMYMMPQADQRPAHNTQNPRQIVAVQQKAIDWLDFWLTGREDPSPDKHEQYTRWHRLSTSSAVANP